MDFSDVEAKLCRATGLTLDGLHDLREDFHQKNRSSELIPFLLWLAEAKGTPLTLEACGLPSCEACNHYSP